MSFLFSPFSILMKSQNGQTMAFCASLGLTGEYIGRIYDEVKRRPQSIVDRKVNFDE